MKIGSGSKVGPYEIRISPDGAFITRSEMEVLSNLVLAENVPAFGR